MRSNYPLPTSFLQRPATPRTKPRTCRIRLLALRTRIQRSCRLHLSSSRCRLRSHPHSRPPSRHSNPQRRRNPRRLNRIELPNPSRHKEALNHTQQSRNRRPEKTQVENPEPRPAQIKMVQPKAAQKKRQQNANHLVAAHCIVLLVENRLRIGISVAAHWGFSLLMSLEDTQPDRARFPAGGVMNFAMPHRPGDTFPAKIKLRPS